MGRRGGVTIAAVVMVASKTVMGVGPTAASSTAQLRAQALSLQQMPAGWMAHVPAKDPRLGCLAHLLEPQGVKETNYYEVYFLNKTDLPFVIETLTTYSSATRAFAKIATRLAACRAFAGKMDGVAVTGKVSPVTMGHFGAASVVYQIAVKGTHYTFRSYYAIVRQGGVLFALLETGYPAVSVSQYRGFLSAALAKVKRVSTSR